MTKAPKYITLTAIIEKNHLTFSYLPPAASKTEILDMDVANPLNLEKKIESEAAQLGDRYHKIILIQRQHVA